MHRAAKFLRFAQLMRVEFADQIFERLADAEHADVGQGRSRQITAQHVARMGAHGGAIGGLRPAPQSIIFLRFAVTQGFAAARIAHFHLLDGQRLGNRRQHRLHLPRVSVEEQIHDFEIGVAVARRHDLGLAVEEIIPGRVLLIEAHVARRFLQRRDADARVFEQLGGDVGNIFAGQMGAAQLRDRIVAVTDQHALVKRSRFFQCRAVGCRLGLSGKEIAQSKRRIAEKFIEESSPQTLRRAAVAREQGAGDLLGQFQAERRTIEIGKKRRKARLFFGSKFRSHSEITSRAHPV